MVRAGAYRDKASFERLTEGLVDDYGNVYSGWSALGSRSSDMRETKGKEKIEAGALSDVASATMRCRSDNFTRGITSADRVQIRGTIWAIKNVTQVDAKNTVIEFLIERGVAS
jgi:head-tail adaptor